MPDIPVIHDRGALLIIRTIIGKSGIHFYIRYLHMKKVHVHPAAHVKPDLDKKIRVV
jgi:hypothetical protein